MAVAAVDRMVHHARIIELSGESYRRKEAEKNKRKKFKPLRHDYKEKTGKSNRH